MIDDTLERANEVAEESKNWIYLRRLSLGGEEEELDPNLAIDSATDFPVFNELELGYGIDNFDDLVKAFVECDDEELAKIAETSNIRVTISGEFELDVKRLAIDIDVSSVERG